MDVRLMCALGMMAMLVTAGCRSTGAAETPRQFPLQTASAEDQALFAEVKASVLKEAAKPPLILTDVGEGYFWVMSARMMPLLDAYEYSGDAAFLDAYVPIQEHVLSQRTRHPTRPDVWTGWWYYKGADTLYDMPIHAAIAYYTPALRFVGFVRADPALRAKYGRAAEAWFKNIVDVEIPSWDKRGTWHDLGDGTGYYTHVTQHPVKGSDKIVAREDLYGGSTLAYNKVHAFIESLVLAHRLTGDDAYRQRIEKCEKFFRNRWRVDDKHAEWNYRDYSGPWDYDPNETQPTRRGASNQHDGRKTKTGYFIHPKGGYYAADLEAIVACYNVGIVFTRADIEKLVRTNLEFMWMGDATDPKFRKIDGSYTEEGKYGKGYLWTALAQFSPQVRSLWKTQVERARKANSYNWAAGALSYLLATAEPVSWEPRYATEIPRKE